MNSSPIDATRIADIAEDVLTRNFGLKGRIKVIREVASNPLIGSVVQVKDRHEKVALLWASFIQKEWYWASTLPSSFEALFCLHESRYNGFEVIGEKISESITSIERPPIDATNLHLKLVCENQKKYHVKEYTRPLRGTREILIGQILAKQQIFPKLVKALLWNDESNKFGLVSVLENYDIRNSLDEESYLILKNFIKSETSMDGYLRLIHQAHKILSTFHNRLSIDMNELQVSIPTFRDEFSKNTLTSEVLSPDLSEFARRALKKIASANNTHNVIHGDIWWRQFSRTSDGQVLLLDLEDIVIGPLAYDYASMYCGIRNQLEYASRELAKTPHQKELIADLMRTVEMLYQSLSLDLFKEAVLLRTVHEYVYSTQRFGQKSWITDFTLSEAKRISKSIQ